MNNIRSFMDEDLSNLEKDWYKKQDINLDPNSAGWTNADVSIPREEWGKFETGGPYINGKKVDDLIKMDLLDVNNLTEEEKQIIYQDIMIGFTNDKDILAKKIDLLINDPKYIKRIMLKSFYLAEKEMFNEIRNYYDNSPRNRKFQFLAIANIIIEKGYNLNNLTFDIDNKTVDLVSLISMFKNNCDKYRASSINDPSWFKDGIKPEDYDYRKVNNPYLYSGVLLKKLYNIDENRFKNEYEFYKKNTRMPEKDILQYEDFIYQYFGLYLDKQENKSLLDDDGGARSR